MDGHGLQEVAVETAKDHSCYDVHAAHAVAVADVAGMWRQATLVTDWKAVFG